MVSAAPSPSTNKTHVRQTICFPRNLRNRRVFSLPKILICNIVGRQVQHGHRVQPGCRWARSFDLDLGQFVGVGPPWNTYGFPGSSPDGKILATAPGDRKREELNRGRESLRAPFFLVSTSSSKRAEHRTWQTRPVRPKITPW